jgi:hypothetical protein
MALSRTPQRYMLPRSETLLSPPPLKRKRVEDNREMLLEATLSEIPASLFLPGVLGDFLSTADLLLQEDGPRICLKPRTSLSMPAAMLPLLKKRASSEVTPLAFSSDAPRRRMKRRRSSMSACGADIFNRLEVTPMAAMIWRSHINKQLPCRLLEAFGDSTDCIQCIMMY